MPIAATEPRVFFAAERTLLAWLRTGPTIIGLGLLDLYLVVSNG